jgi:hypothetical protein
MIGDRVLNDRLGPDRLPISIVSIVELSQSYLRFGFSGTSGCCELVSKKETKTKPSDRTLSSESSAAMIRGRVQCWYGATGTGHAKLL